MHLAVAEVPGVTTESVGDAFSKTVLISATEVAAQDRSDARRAPSHGLGELPSRRCRSPPHDTIVAIATPPGRGGIGVVRLSGPTAHCDRARLITHAASARAAPRDADDRFRHAARHDRIVARRRSIRSSSTYFPAPASYTGDDVVEISAHGSPVVLQAIVRGGDRARARGSPSRASSRCARF